MTYTCTRCGDTRTETIDPLGHAPAEAVRENEEASSCEEPGSYDSVVYCSRCRAELSREHIEGEIIGHAWDEGKVTTPATCTQEGVMTYTCTRCGDTKTETIEAKGHTEAIDAAVAPTCTETGLTEGKHCSVCNEVLVEQEVVPATEHAYSGTVTKQPTCTETGVCTYTCTHCGDQYTAFIAAFGHDYVSKVEHGATCTQTGSILYTCTRCGNSYQVTTYANHDYRLIETVAATCTQPGYQLFRCSVCGDEYKIDIPAEAGHNYVGVVTVAPTTEREGIMTYTCTVCGDSYTVPLAKLNSGNGHVLLIQDRLPWTTDNNAVILNYLTDTQQIGGWELVTAAEAASVDFADYDVVYIANDQTTATYNRLKALDDELTQFVQAGGVLIYGACDHGWGAGDISYDLPGGVRIDNYYSNYNYIVDDAHDVITGVLTGGVKLTNDILYSTYSSHTTFHDLPEDHNVILQDAKGDPTLVEYALGDGYVIASGLTWEYTYERTFVDGTSFAKEIYDDLFVYAMTLADPCEHQYEEGETVAPTCMEDGYTVYTCMVCGREYHGNLVLALGHDWDEGKVTTPATCTQEGVMTYTCERCGDTKTETIAMKEHTVAIDAAVAPTCTETGLTEGKHCSVCEKVLVEQEVVPALDHAWDDGEVTTPATCTQEGVMTYTCERCGKTETRPIEAKGHTEAIDAAVAPTCTETGLTEGKHCSVCNEVLVEQEVLPALDHDWDEGKVTTPATCTQEGVMTYTCERCGDTKTEPIAMTEHTVAIDAAVAPTCTETGLTEGSHCSVCNEVLVEQEALPALDHDWDEGKVTTPATCTQEGVMTYTCTRCGDTKTETIEATGHTEAIDAAVAPTCTETGLTEGSHCSVCGKVLVEQEVLQTIPHNYVNGVCTMCGKPEEGVATEGLVFTLSDDGTYYSVTDYTGSAKEVSIPSIHQGLPVTSIGDEAFYRCTRLTNVTIGNGVTSIGNRAFYSCDSLTSVTIGDSVTSIGSYAFSYCDSLTSVYITDIAAWCAIDFGGYYSNPLYYAHNLYLNGELVTDLVIPDSVTSIGDWAFYNCSGLTSVTIGDSVTSIGNQAFYRCTNLTSITIPDSVTSIGEYAFYYCTSLTSVTIGDGVTSIGDWAFSYCDSLTSITIPDSVTSIGESAFRSCYSLTSVTIGDGVTSIGSYAFSDCLGLTSVVFENPNGWRAYVTAISAADLSDPATAAQYLTDEYNNYTWTRK